MDRIVIVLDRTVVCYMSLMIYEVACGKELGNAMGGSWG